MNRSIYLYHVTDHHMVICDPDNPMNKRSMEVLGFKFNPNDVASVKLALELGVFKLTLLDYRSLDAHWILEKLHISDISTLETF